MLSFERAGETINARTTFGRLSFIRTVGTGFIVIYPEQVPPESMVRLYSRYDGGEEVVIRAVFDGVLLPRAAATPTQQPRTSEPTRTATPTPQPTTGIVSGSSRGQILSIARFLSYTNGVMSFERGGDILTGREGSGPGTFSLSRKVGPRFASMTPEELPEGSLVDVVSLRNNGVEVIDLVIFDGDLAPTPTATAPQDGDGQPSFQLNPSSGAPGDRITVSSTTLPEDDRTWVMLIYNSEVSSEEVWETAQVRTGGVLTAEFVVPDLPSGEYAFLLYTANTFVHAEGQFTVINGVEVTPTRRPTATARPTATPIMPRIVLQTGHQGLPGDTILIDGFNFPRDTAVSRVEFGGIGEIQVLPTPNGPVRTGADGRFTAVAIVPDVEAGSYSLVVVVGSGPGEVMGSRVFEVLP